MRDIIQKAKYPLPSRHLEERILTRIARARLVGERIRAGLFGGTVVASALAFIPAVTFALQEIAHSAFYDYVSLTVTDGGTLMSSWHEFGLAVIESAPINGIILTLSLVLVFMASLRALFKHTDTIVNRQKSFAT